MLLLLVIRPIIPIWRGVRSRKSCSDPSPIPEVLPRYINLIGKAYFLLLQILYLLFAHIPMNDKRSFSEVKSLMMSKRISSADSNE